jgi:hypothetical protein
MGCEQSTPVERREALPGVGGTERQISKLQKAASTGNSQEVEKGKVMPKVDEQGYLTAEEVAKRTFSSICNREVTLGTPSNVTHVQVGPSWNTLGACILIRTNRLFPFFLLGFISIVCPLDATRVLSR